MATGRGGPQACVMQSIPRSRPDRHTGRLICGTLAGACLVAFGLGLAYMVIGTPLVARLLPGGQAGRSQVAFAPLVWTLALAAGAALLVAGTNRLALTVASVQRRYAGRSPVMRVKGALPDEILVALAVVPLDGRPIPELVIGPFGVAIVQDLEGRDRLRPANTSWEMRTREGWVPTEHPLDRVARDAERVRHWLTHGDLDYVVRVYAALVTPDVSMPRTPSCAVISEDQIADRLAALPRQRSFSAARRNHLLTRIRAAGVTEAPRRGW